MTQLYFHYSSEEEILIDRCGSELEDRSEAHAKGDRPDDHGDHLGPPGLARLGSDMPVTGPTTRSASCPSAS